MMNEIKLYSVEASATWQWQSDSNLSLAATGRWLWLQRLLIRLWKKLGGRVRQDFVQYKYITVSLDDLVKAAMSNQANVMRIYNRESKYLIVGRTQFALIAQNYSRFDSLDSYLRFSIPFEYNARVGVDSCPQPKMFAGLEVVVVPWIDGLFVLPDLEGK